MPSMISWHSASHCTQHFDLGRKPGGRNPILKLQWASFNLRHPLCRINTLSRLEPGCLTGRMVAQVEYTNAFAADGIVPSKYGLRTVVEYRSQLFTVPRRATGATDRDQPDDDDVDMITPTPSRGRPEIGMAPRLGNGSLRLPDMAENEHALRALGNTLDMSGLGALDPKYLGVLVVDRPMSLKGRVRPVLARQTLPEATGWMSTIRRVASALFSPPQASRETEPSILSWHWADDLIAVATGAHLDRICAYNFNTNQWETSPNRIESLAGIRCMAFRPFSGRVLALGCEAGVALLKGPDLHFLEAPGHTRVVSLDWSPDGSKLATASAGDGMVRIWDIGTRESIVLGRGDIVRFSRGIGSILFVANSASSSFKLWTWGAWKNERWGNLAGPVSAATWSPDGTTLLFGTQGESAIHVISIGGPDSDDETRVVHTELTGMPQEGPGGTPTMLEMDSTGERLAVAYELAPDEDDEQEDVEVDDSVDLKRRYAVALYATQLEPNFGISPLGYVSGPERSGPPVALKFKPKDDSTRATILSCMWRSGDITFTQLLFNPLRQGF